jgi:hypothetical protein
MPKISYTIRLQPELLAKIQEDAKNNYRSVNNYIETILSISIYGTVRGKQKMKKSHEK